MRGSAHQVKPGERFFFLKIMINTTPIETQTTENPTRRGLMNNAEAAEYLGVSPITLWRERRRGRLTYRRIGGQIRYAPEDLEALLELCRVN